MKITVTNTALLNAGDAAIMAGTDAILRDVFGSDITVELRDQQAEDSRTAYGDYRVEETLYCALESLSDDTRRPGLMRLMAAAALWRTPLRNLARRLVPARVRAVMDGYAESDLIVSAGGTYLVPHYRIRPKILELLAARLMRRPYVLFTQSLGPFPRDRVLLRAIFAGAHAVLVRDSRSVEHLLDLGVRGDRIAICADAAFALAGRPTPVSEASNKLRVGISVRDWPHGGSDADRAMQNYVAAVAKLVRHLTEGSGAEVTFVSTCQGAGSYWTDDSAVADRVVAEIGWENADRVQVDRSFRSPQQLMDHLAGYDMYVSTRMHGAILALCAGVPVLPIAYEFKTNELFKRLGMEEIVQDLTSISGAALCRTCRMILDNRAAYRERIREILPDLRESAYAAGQAVAIGLERNR